MNSFSLADLCDLADVTPRTVRFYIAQGLLRPPSGAGPAARYDDGHLDRLRLIRRLQRDHLPLVEIRRRLDALTDADVTQLAREPAAVADTAADYVARVLGAKGVGGQREPLARRPAPDTPGALEPSAPSPGAPEPTMRSPTPIPEAAYASLAAESGSAHTTTDPEPARSQWDRIVLAPEIELHVRRPLGRLQHRRVDRLVAAARAIFKEEGE